MCLIHNPKKGRFSKIIPQGDFFALTHKDEILEMALRLKSLDIKLLVDFHYSHNWADPGKQIKPPAWKDYDFEQLKTAVYEHTFDICNNLVAQGTPPDMVQ